MGGIRRWVAMWLTRERRSQQELLHETGQLEALGAEVDWGAARADGTRGVRARWT
jgi:hypothetical protein